MHLPDDLVTTEHAARIAAAHVAVIRRLIRKGQLRGYRLAGSRRWMVSRAELLACWQTSEEDLAQRRAHRLETRSERTGRQLAVEARLKAKGIG